MGAQSSCAVHTGDEPHGAPADAVVVVRLGGEALRLSTARWRELSRGEQLAVQALADSMEEEPIAGAPTELRPFDAGAIVVRAHAADGALVGMSRARPYASLSWARHRGPDESIADAEARMVARGAPTIGEGRLDLLGWEMSGTIVVERLRRSGLGARLLTGVLAAIGAAPVAVHIDEHRLGALRLFEGAGFERTGHAWLAADGARMVALRRPALRAGAPARTLPSTAVIMMPML